MQIAQAKASGDEETVAALTGHKENIASQGAFQQMQQYTLQNQARQQAYQQAYQPFMAMQMQQQNRYLQEQ